jgi:hypothetical protein
MLARAYSFAPILFLSFAIAAPAAAAPEMFSASFIWHAWSNDISSGTAAPYLDNYFTAAPRGFDCQHASPYTTNGAPATRYCTPNVVMQGHPAIGKTYTAHGQGVAPSRSIGSGTPPRITMQQSDFTVGLVTYTNTTQTWGEGQCCRGFLITYPPYIQSFTYATFVNAAGSFFANGGAVAAGLAKNIGGTGTGRYNNRTGMGVNNKGTWRIRAGANAFGGAMGLLGKYGAVGKYTDEDLPGVVFSGTSSWAMVPPLGRPYKNTPTVSAATDGMGNWTAYYNPYDKTDMWFTPMGSSTINAVGVGTLWTTGQVGNFAKTGAFHTSQWRTGYDNRTAGGKGVIQLVTPTLTHWLSPGWNTHSAQTGILRIQVPEPGAVLLLAAGGGVLGLLFWVSRRV